MIKHSSKILDNLRDVTEDEVRNILAGNLTDNPPGQGEVSALMNEIRKVLQRRLQEAYTWGYGHKELADIIYEAILALGGRPQPERKVINNDN